MFGCAGGLGARERDRGARRRAAHARVTVAEQAHQGRDVVGPLVSPDDGGERAPMRVMQAARQRRELALDLRGMVDQFGDDVGEARGLRVDVERLELDEEIADRHVPS